jgi:hypothetical protein
MLSLILIHRYYILYIERKQTCTATCLTSSKDQKLECFKWKANSIFKFCENLENVLFCKVMLIFYLTQARSMYNIDI